MCAKRYTADSVAAAPPLYFAVNVYRTKSGWMVSSFVRQAGGRSPRTHRQLHSYYVAPADKTLGEAMRMAARELLRQAPAEDGH